MNEDMSEDKSVHTDATVPIPPPRKRAKRTQRKHKINSPATAAELADFERAREVIASLPPPNLPPLPSMASTSSVTMEQILAAKAILAQAEAALGVAREVKKEAPVPLHPQSLEDPAQGDKTPAVVDWYYKHAHEEYLRRYSGRKTHREDRRKERPYQPLPEGAVPAGFPADPDGKFMVGGVEADLSKTDHSGNSPRDFRDIK